MTAAFSGAAGPPSVPLQVLIVEDSENDALLAIRALRIGGFAPSWRRVETADAMRDALAQSTWQLILSDHNLPAFDALEAFAIYRQAGLDIPFIIVSGAIGEHAAVAAMKAGVHDYLAKGRLARLAPAVRRELQDAQSRRDRARVEAELHSTYSELAAIHANAPVGLLVVDGDLRIKRVNEMAARMAGRPAAEMTGLGWGEALGCQSGSAGVDGCGQGPGCEHCPLREAVLSILHGGTEGRRVEMSFRIPVNGQTEDRWLQVSSGLMESDGRRLVLVCAQDITEVKQAHRDLEAQRDAMALHAHLINLSHDAIIIADAERTIRSWNKGAREIYGWTADQASGAAMQSLIPVCSALPAAEIDRQLFENGYWEGELRHTGKDGRQVSTDSRQVLLRDKDGRSLAILEINRDITERQRAESTLLETMLATESALAEKTVLLQEIHHRVKNNLAVIASLLSMKAAATSSEEARLALEASRERVHSMALIHEYLYSGDNLDRLNFSEYARELVRQIHSALQGDRDRVAVELALDPIELDLKQAVPCALILNELLSNAFKYAFPDDRHGTIRISFHEVAPLTLELVVEDDGVGLPPGTLEPADSPSLGLRIVGILTQQLDGSIEQQEGAGTRTVIRFPARLRKEAIRT